MAHQVLISYSSHDKNVADAICSWLERNDIRCWIAPRDITPGVEYGESIINAINACEVMVVVFTDNANHSRFVRKEVERAVSKGCVVVPVRLQDVLPTQSLEFFLSSDHWLDATSPPVERHLDKLVNTVQMLLSTPHTILPSLPNRQQDRADIKLFNELAPSDWGRKPTSNLFERFVHDLFNDKS